MYLDFPRRTQRCDPCRHPRSREIPDFDQNYHVTLFQKIRIFRGFTEGKEEGATRRRRKKQEERTELYDCSPIPAETAKVKDRGAVCKVLEKLPEVRDKHAIHISGISNATLC